uniref:Uncharacterized protein n=1 Tax=Megaselia scalaris TaxID=36166 RepID=T1GF67_MEGSC
MAPTAELLLWDVQDNEILEYGNGRQGPFVEWILGLLGPAWRPTTPKPQVDTTPVTTTAAPQRDDCKECG